MTPKGHGVIRGCRDPLYDLKGHGDLCGHFDVFMTPKGQGVIRGRHDLLYDRKDHGDLYNWFDLVYDHKRTLEVAVTCFMTPKVNLTFDLDLDIKVKHLAWQVTTDVQATL